MKASTLVLAALVAAAPTLQTSHAQGLLDRLKRKADEVADAARDLGEDIDDVTSVDEQAAARVDATERGIERDAERAVGDTAPARTARDVERGLQSAEAEVQRADAQVEHAASTDERTAAEARQNAAALERDLDVESRARGEVRGNATVRDAARTTDALSRADEIAATEAERRVDGAVDARSVERRVDEQIGAREAERSLENASDAVEALRRR
jgi:hypothetical protein